jgi:hypothetical protein
MEVHELVNKQEQDADSTCVDKLSIFSSAFCFSRFR